MALGTRSSRHALARATAAVVAFMLVAGRADAQAWFYPSFQTPRAVEREYNFAAVASEGADFLGQWREGIDDVSQFSFDAGLADPKGASNTRLFVAANYGREITRATDEQPIDLMVTGGAGLAFGANTLLRIPVGVSVGHTFPLDERMSITPYVHPRVSLDVATKSGGGTNLSLDFDVGASFAVTRALALRAALVVSGNDAASSTGFGIGLTLTPAALSR